MAKLTLRTKSITTKVSEEEYAGLERLAGVSGQSISEWCREVLLERANGHNTNGQEPTVLAELLALRTILLNLFYALSRGEEITGGEMQEIIARADSDKLTKARERLQGSVAGKPEASA